MRRETAGEAAPQTHVYEDTDLQKTAKAVGSTNTNSSNDNGLAPPTQIPNNKDRPQRYECESRKCGGLWQPAPLTKLCEQ